MKFIFVAFAIVTSQCLAEESSSPPETGKAVEMDPACKNLKCPAVSDPLCVRLKYLTPTFVKRNVYVIMVNRCEMKYVRCHKGVHATELPMSFCEHKSNTTEKDADKHLELIRRVKKDFAERRYAKLASGVVKKRSKRSADSSVVNTRRQDSNNYPLQKPKRSDAKVLEAIAHNARAKKELFNKPLKKYKLPTTKTKSKTGKAIGIHYSESGKKQPRGIVSDAKEGRYKLKGQSGDVASEVEEGAKMKLNGQPGGAISEAEEVLFIPPSNGKDKLNGQSGGVISEAEEGAHVLPPKGNNQLSGQPGGAISGAEEAAYIPPPKGNNQLSGQPGGAISDADEVLFIPPPKGNNQLSGQPGGVISDAEEGSYIPPPKGNNQLSGQPGGAISDADEVLFIPPPKGNNQLSGQPGGLISAAEEGAYIPPPKGNNQLSGQPGGLISAAEEGAYIPPPKGNNQLSGQPGGVISDVEEGVYIPPPKGNNQLSGQPGGVISDAEEGVYIPPPKGNNQLSGQPGGVISDVEEGVYIPPPKGNNQLSGQPGGVISDAEEGVYIPPPKGNNGQQGGAISDAEEGAYIPPPKSKRPTQLKEDLTPHSAGSEEYIDKKSAEIAAVTVDPEQDNAECPTKCPAQGVMVCAKCRHGTYRTFLSRCHMRMFECINEDENKGLTLISNRPCTMSLPYVENLPPTQGLLRERDEEDVALRYIKCQHYAFKKIRPWVNLNCTF